MPPKGKRGIRRRHAVDEHATRLELPSQALGAREVAGPKVGAQAKREAFARAMASSASFTTDHWRDGPK